MSIKLFFKQLFCKHNWEQEATVTGFENNKPVYRCIILECTKCHKKVSRKGYLKGVK